MLAVLLAAAAPLSALALGRNTSDHPTPDGYDEHDYQALVAFLDTEDSAGMKNGDKLAAFWDGEYDPADPETWRYEGQWGESAGAFWTDGAVKKLAWLDINPNESDYEEKGPIERGYAAPLVGPLDLSGCTELELLDCGENELTYINVSDCTGLRMLYTDGNMTIEQLKMSGCSALVTLECSNCGLTELDLEGMTSLETLVCGRNMIDELDISDCVSLKKLMISDNPIDHFDISGNQSIERFEAEGCGMTVLRAENCPELKSVICGYNGLEAVCLNGSGAMEYLHLECNSLTSVDVSGMPELRGLDCSVNHLAELDVACCPLLETLSVRVNDISELDLSCNPLLLHLETDFNPIRELDFSGNPLIPFEGLAAEGSGYVAFSRNWDENWPTAIAQKEQGAKFVGWYDENGELISESPYLYAMDEDENELDFGVVTARFTRLIVPGDVNGSGTVDTSDALLILRFAMGLAELDGEQFTAADVNGSGTVDTSDALAVLRTAMGLA